MATTNKIENVCHAIQKTDITLEAPNGGFVNGKNIRFKDACNQLFSEASRIRLSDGFEMIHSNLKGSNIFALFDTIDEVFRYGEEINTATFRSYAMSDHFPFYKKPTPNFVGERYDPFITPENKRIDLKLSFARARLEEAGLWEEFQAKLSTSDKYDPSSVGKEDPEVVEFLRLALRGSGKYPRAPQEWKP